jgi:hypothetical protein
LELGVHFCNVAVSFAELQSDHLARQANGANVFQSPEMEKSKEKNNNKKGVYWLGRL